MQFASITYMAFLAVSVIVYFSLPGPRTRALWLLAASYAFYWSLSPRWTVVLAAVTLVGYAAAAGIAAAPQGSRRRRAILGAGIAVVVATLAFFKYTDFAASLLNSGLAAAGASARSPLLRIALPVGISFWTFQTIAYLVEVSRGTLAPERDLVRYGVFIAFFPHVAAGPIARGGQLLPQLAENHRFDYDGMRSGLLLMGWGFFKKLVVADTLAVLVDRVYADPRAFPGSTSGLVLGIATIAFAVQLYCDFSGYTDLARGAARLFGVELARNFDRPYFADSVKEFWRRWHMTLMGWLRDFVYIPLGGSRVPPARRRLNVLAVFLVSGIWHGAGLTFVVWGLLNGAYQVLGELTAPLRRRAIATLRIDPESRAWHAVRIAVTFLLITVAWVFFRAGSLADALYIVPRMFSPTLHVLWDPTLAHLGLRRIQLLVAVLGAVVVFVMDHLSQRHDLPGWLTSRPLPLRWAGYLALVLVTAVVGRYGPAYSAAAFAYFKF